MAQVLVSNSTGDIPTVVLGSSGAGFALIGYVMALLLSDVLDCAGSKRLVLITVGGGAAVLTVIFSPSRSAFISHFVGALLGLIAGRLHILGWSLR